MPRARRPNVLDIASHAADEFRCAECGARASVAQAQAEGSVPRCCGDVMLVSMLGPTKGYVEQSA